MPGIALAGVRQQLGEALDAVAGVEPGHDLADLLYARWFALPRWPVRHSPHCPKNLVELLRAAHAGARLWEEGWLAERVGPRGQVIARRGSELRLVERADYVAVRRRGLLPRPGDELVVTGRRDLVSPEDGWWRTGGPAWSWSSPPAGLVRLYWNTEPAGLPGLVERLTGLLAGEPEPWLLKCASDISEHARADAALLYLTPDSLGRLADGALDAALALGEHARAGAPPLTLPVAPGLAVAFDPGGEESFGGHRCRLVAEAILADGSLDAVAERFSRDGVDLARPWARTSDPLLEWEC